MTEASRFTNLCILIGIVVKLLLLPQLISGKIIMESTILSYKNDQILYSMIFPGTKWCGPGNNADGYEDLGKFRETDKCCRDHDNCDSIPAGGEKYGLQNNGRYTRLHCKCDKNFYDCLHKVNDRVSNIVGRTYFQFTNLCYREDRPKTGCLETEISLFDKRCVKYSYDRSEPKRYQWFDLPYYNSEKFPDLRGSEAEDI